MTLPNKIKLTLLPKQLEYLQATEREVLYSGAFRAGKTFALCVKLVQRASNPRAREGLCRKTLISLKGSTLRTLLEGDGSNPPILPPGSYEHNKAEKTIQLRGGGQIVYFGLDDEQKIAGFTLTGCGIDEAIELDEDEWTMIRGRCSTTLPNLQTQIYAACNPHTPKHFLAVRFGLAGNPCIEGCKAIQTKSFDNPFLPADYVADLKTYTGVRKARYVDGLWVGSEGLVYDAWDRAIHVGYSASNNWKRIIVSVDDGMRDPMAALRVCEDDYGVYVEREIYQSGLLMERKAELISELAIGAEAVVYDSAALELGEELRNVGLPVRPAKKKRSEGIAKVQSLLAITDGHARLKVSPDCTNLIAEIESYEWKPGTELPQDHNDHLCDSLRYLAMYLDKGRPYIGGWVNSAEKEKPNKTTKETLHDYYAKIQKDPVRYFRPESTKRNQRGLRHRGSF